MAGYVRWWHDSEALTGPAYVGYRAKTGKHLLVARFLSLALNRRATELTNVRCWGTPENLCSI